MAQVYVDEDMRGEAVRWFRSQRDFEASQVPIGPCPHDDCPHNGISDVGWGGDLRHYTVVRCFDCKCRGWLSEETDRRGAWGWQQTAERG